MKQYLLIWRLGNHFQELFKGSVQLCQQKRSELKRQPQFQGGIFQIRTVGGYENNKFWVKTKKI